MVKQFIHMHTNHITLTQSAHIMIEPILCFVGFPAGIREAVGLLIVDKEQLYRQRAQSIVLLWGNIAENIGAFSWLNRLVLSVNE